VATEPTARKKAVKVTQQKDENPTPPPAVEPDENPTPPPVEEAPLESAVQTGDKPVEVLASEYLSGHWGDYKTSYEMLQSAGYDPRAVHTEVNRRLAAGAPSAYKPTLREVGAQAIRGEWGDDTVIEKRLEAAGHNVKEVASEVDRQLGN
jgi:outer membrane biosynthesis protein TonB